MKENELESLRVENEYLRMRLAEIPDLLDEIDQEGREWDDLRYCRIWHEAISEVRRRIVD